jgi:hypothetical protein
MAASTLNPQATISVERLVLKKIAFTRVQVMPGSAQTSVFSVGKAATALRGSSGGPLYNLLKERTFAADSKPLKAAVLDQRCGTPPIVCRP